VPARELVARFMLKIVVRDSLNIPFAVLDHEVCRNEVACTTIVSLRIRIANNRAAIACF